MARGLSADQLWVLWLVGSYVSLDATLSMCMMTPLQN